MMFHRNTSGADVLCGSYLGGHLVAPTVGFHSFPSVSHSESVTNTEPLRGIEGGNLENHQKSRSRTSSVGSQENAELYLPKIREKIWPSAGFYGLLELFCNFIGILLSATSNVAKDPSFGIQGSADSDSLPKKYMQI